MFFCRIELAFFASNMSVLLSHPNNSLLSLSGLVFHYDKFHSMIFFLVYVCIN